MKLSDKEVQKVNTKAGKNFKEPGDIGEIYVNNLYEIFVRRGLPSPFKNEQGEPVTIAHLSIKHHDRRAKPDWRHFQWIKNEIVGPECEGIELFPKESRLVDGANQFHIWVFEDSSMYFPFGFWGRIVTEKVSLHSSTQRKFPENRKPDDLKEIEEKFTELKTKRLKDQ